MWPFTFIMSLSTRCANTVMACCRTPASGSCSELPHSLRPYKCSVHGSTAFGNRNARSPRATIRAALVPLSLSSRSRVKIKERCSSQKPPSIAINLESAASAALRKSGAPVATAGCPHSATTTGAYAATKPFPLLVAFTNATSSFSHVSLALSRCRSSETAPCPSAAASSASSPPSLPAAAAASDASDAARSRAARARLTALPRLSTCTRCFNPTSPMTNRNRESEPASTAEAGVGGVVSVETGSAASTVAGALAPNAVAANE
mmetsp:Transcript_9238/g.30737  ORF Transcript_9238/g.30737 Transcript_9238/m.30737 type:complete len:263 (-) Transcript_9238:253-1041(-)